MEQPHEEPEEYKTGDCEELHRGWSKERWETCWRKDRLDAVGWAAIFIWAALVILAGTTGFGAKFSWWNGWAVFFTGAGAIVLLGTAIRLVIPEYRKEVLVGVIFGCILLAIGLGDWGWFWPLVLIAIAIAILAKAFSRRP
ncbi:hypothetical protein E3J62_08525 [candidate division TA06 bacterium]|uniref:Uncharacterized protein n=1 Tax=candidate division TA06 bacterium TaxID=2250710 RepID=A0A523URM3_UNCT6|nr:MAG: hypothetical protein E3J62_08525 [candidate division TA06 bacterium]